MSRKEDVKPSRSSFEDLKPLKDCLEFDVGDAAVSISLGFFYKVGCELLRSCGQIEGQQGDAEFTHP